MTVRSVGVEEELLLVEPGTGRPRAVAEAALREIKRADGADGAEGLPQDEPEDGDAARSLDFELQSQQLETNTRPCHALDELGQELRRCRALAAFGLTAYEQLTCGCHVHVAVGSPDEGVAVLDRIGPWLPVLLALSANSPFWQGQDSSYASFDAGDPDRRRVPARR